MDVSMEKILYPGSKWRIAQCALYGLLSFFFLTKFFRGGAPTLLPCVFFLVLAIERGLGYIPRGAFLKLDQQGFTTCYWFRETSYRWCDIAEFRVITYRYLGIIPYRRLVGFRYTESSGKRHLALRIVGAIARFDRALPDTYGMKATELAPLLERWRLGSVAADQAQAPWISSSWLAAGPRS
jgi:hypothetical protein